MVPQVRKIRRNDDIASSNYGSFYMNTLEETERAFADYLDGRV